MPWELSVASYLYRADDIETIINLLKTLLQESFYSFTGIAFNKLVDIHELIRPETRLSDVRTYPARCANHGFIY